MKKDSAICSRKIPSSADFGAVGDGVADDTVALQALLDSGAPRVKILNGNYRVTHTLRVPSRITIDAAPCARVFSCGNTPKHRGDFLLTNSDHIGGNQDIIIRGGIWDGNNQGPQNQRPDDPFDPAAWSGTTLHFLGVRTLRLERLTIANSVLSDLQLARVDGFALRHIRFQNGTLFPNRSGIHIAGCCRNGLVSDIQFTTNGQPSGDFIALTADTFLERCENRDLVRGPIENVTISHVRAKNCHTAIRLQSTRSTIRNIRIRDVETGVGVYAIDADAGRHRPPLCFDEADFPQGVGHLDNVLIENLRFWTTRPDGPAPICLEENSAGFRIRNFERDLARDARPDIPTLSTAFLRAETRLVETPNGIRMVPPTPASRASAPVRFPTHVLLERGLFEVTSPFGPRVHPVTGKKFSFHSGVDGALWDGRMLVETGICAWDAGTVSVAEDSDGPAGTNVSIDHGDGLVSRYFHLERGSLRVSPGDRVSRGTRLGWMGRTGRSTGEHLHFQMERDGVPVDPMPYLAQGGSVR